MPKNRGLGRGLDAIYIDNSLPTEKTDSERKTLPIARIDVNSDQPRKTFPPDALAELADSIRENGLLQPILVRRKGDDRFEIIAGERRFRASKLAGLESIPVIILEADDKTAAKYALIENLQREDLNPYEEAMAYRAMMDNFGLTQEEVSAALGKSRSAVANSLRLLDAPEGVANMLRSGLLSAGHARALLGLKDRGAIIQMAKDCAGGEWSVRQLEDAVRKANRAPQKETPAKTSPDVDYVRAVADRFTSRTGRRCRIEYSRNKKSFEVEFRDNRDLESICKLLAGEDFFDEF